MSFPRLVKVRQGFPRPHVGDVEAAVRGELEKEEISPRIRSGMRIALTAGSRGIAGIDAVLRTLAAFVKEKGAEPFVVPAMGSHGGATAGGQVGVLEGLGVTEGSVGARILSSLEIVELGRTGRGVPVYMDRHASEADGVVVVNRIKAHTSFSHRAQSGLLKMAAVGLGKHEAALELHGGPNGFGDRVFEVGEAVFGSGRVLFGLALLENAYDELARVEAIPPEDVSAREPELLEEYMSVLMPALPVKEIDVLFVDTMGKDYSGTGMDTNVVGRYRIPGVEDPESPKVKYLIAGRLSEGSRGNALGMGLADLTTERLLRAVDFGATNANAATSTFLERAKVPMVLPNDREALETAFRANWGVAPEETRMARIPNTLRLDHVYLSENLAEEALKNGNVEVVGEAAEPEFDEDGYLKDF